MVVGKEGRRGEAEREAVGTEVWQGIKFAQNILNDYFLYKGKYCEILTLTGRESMNPKILPTYFMDAP